MKQILAILAAAALLLTGCSPAQTDSSNPQETVVVYKKLPLPQLSVDIPEQYTSTSTDFYEEFYVNADASIIITEDTSQGRYDSAKEYSIEALTKYQNATEELKVIGDGVVYAGSIAVYYLEFTYTMGEGENAITKTTLAGFMTDARSMFIITCKCDPENYDSHREEFLSVMQSAVIIR